jgi:hypothetical protein
MVNNDDDDDDDENNNREVGQWLYGFIGTNSCQYLTEIMLVLFVTGLNCVFHVRGCIQNFPD